MSTVAPVDAVQAAESKDGTKNFHVHTSTAFVYALSLCIMNGKHVVIWSRGLATAGLPLFSLAVIFAGAIYIMLTYSFAEMVSIVPFSGGCYAYTRCTMGPTLGYITGVMEGGKYVLYTTMTAYLIGIMFQQAFEYEDQYLPAVWLAFYVSAVLLQIFGTKAIWWTWGFLAVGTFTMQLLFIFGAIKAGRTAYLSPRYNEFVNDGATFLQVLPTANFFFTGIDAVRTCANDQTDKTVPRAMVSTMFFALVMSLCTLVAARAYVADPVEFTKDIFPSHVGISIAFPHMQAKLVALLAMPGLLGSGLGLAYASGRQVRSMACSGLLPAFLASAQKDEQNGVVQETKPIAAIVACSVVSYGLLVGGFYEVTEFFTLIVRMGGLQTSLEVLGMMGAYIVFATRFGGMERPLRSPVGIPGAVAVMAYVTMTFISALFYDARAEGLGVTLLVYFAACMLYYFAVANQRQFFSKEEQDKFMKAYVVNANAQRRSGRKGSSKKSAPRGLLDRVLGTAMIMGKSIGSQRSSAGSGRSGGGSPSRRSSTSGRVAPSTTAPLGLAMAHAVDAGGALVPIQATSRDPAHVPPMFTLGDDVLQDATDAEASAAGKAMDAGVGPRAPEVVSR